MGYISKIKSRIILTGKKMLQGPRATSESYVSYLRSIGVEVGDDVSIFAPGKTHIEDLNPHLLTIGSHVAMTGPVTILLHDYSVGVTKVWTHGEVLGSQKPVTIGNNVFIGWGPLFSQERTLAIIASSVPVQWFRARSMVIRFGEVFPRGAFARLKSTTNVAEGSSLTRQSKFIRDISSVSGRPRQKRFSMSTFTFLPLLRAIYATFSRRSSTITEMLTSA